MPSCNLFQKKKTLPKKKNLFQKKKLFPKKKNSSQKKKNSSQKKKKLFPKKKKNSSKKKKTLPKKKNSSKKKKNSSPKKKLFPKKKKLFQKKKTLPKKKKLFQKKKKLFQKKKKIFQKKKNSSKKKKLFQKEKTLPKRKNSSKKKKLFQKENSSKKKKLFQKTLQKKKKNSFEKKKTLSKKKKTLSKKMGLFARCDMLRSSTHSRACLAMCLSGQSCARIAAWLKLFHLRVRLVCPAFALLVGLMLSFRGVLYVGITWPFVVAVCRSWLFCWTSSQLVDCDTFDSACYLLTPGQCDCVCEAWQVFRGQLQLHRKQCLTSGCTFGIIPVNVTGTKDVSVNNNEALTADFVQPPFSVAIEADGVFLPFVFRWCHAVLVRHELRPRCSFRRCGTDESTGCRIVFTCCDTVLHERGSCFACQLIHYPVSIGFWCALLVLYPVPCPAALHCQCSESTLEPLLVDQPRSHDVPTFCVESSVLLGVSAFSFCAGCSGAAALFLPCVFSGGCERHIQCGQDLTRTPLYKAPEGTIISFPRPRFFTGSH